MSELLRFDREATISEAIRAEARARNSLTKHRDSFAHPVDIDLQSRFQSAERLQDGFSDHWIARPPAQPRQKPLRFCRRARLRPFAHPRVAPRPDSENYRATRLEE